MNVGLSASGSTYTVYIGPSTTTFTLSGTLGSGTFSNNQGGGETLAYNSTSGQFSFTTSDGSVLVFSSASGAAPYTPQTLTYPAGEQLTYYSNGVVTTNLGYQLRPTLNADGSWNKVVLFNMNNETCDPTASSCTLSGSWPTIDFAAQTVNGNPSVKWASSGTTLTETIPVSSTQNEILTFQTESDGKVDTVTDGNGVWTYTYPGGGVTLKQTGNGSSSDPVRGVRVVNWDGATGLVTEDQIVPQNGELNDTYLYTYDTYQRVQTITHKGVKSTYTYDPYGRGNVTQVDATPTNGDTGQNITTRASFPTTCSNSKTCNKPTSTTDANGNTTNYTYDPNSGAIATITYPAVTVPNVGSVNPVITYNYSTYNETWKSGSGTTITGSAVYRPHTISRCMTQATCSPTTNLNDQVLTTFGYDTTNGLQPSSITTGTNGSASPVLQATTGITYTTIGDVQTVTSPLSAVSWFAHDNDRRLTGAIGPLPGNGQAMRAIKISYTSGGLPDTRSIGTASAQSTAALASMTVLQKSQASYNVQALKTQDTLYDNSGTVAGVTQYSYTPEHMPQCVAARNDSSTWTSQSNACAQTSTGTDLITKYTYDDAGNLLTLRNGYTSDTQVPDMTNGWTDGSMLATQQDGNGKTTTYSYDIFNRLDSTCYPDTSSQTGASSTTDCEILTYDKNNNLYSRQVRSGELISYRYDALNRLTLKSSSALADVSYSYDLLNRMLTATFNGSGQGTTNSWDVLGRLTSTSSNVGGTAHAFGYQYNLANQLTQLTYPDNSYINYDRLATGEVSKIRENGASSGVGVLATYAYDALGNRSSVTYGNLAVQTYTPDSLFRLWKLNTDLEGSGTTNDFLNTLGYSGVSQITSLSRTNNNYIWSRPTASYTYGVNPLNQYTTNGITTFAYDARGNLKQSGSTYYCYDVENRLTAVAGNSACSSPNATLAYEPLGRLSSVSGSATTRSYITASILRRSTMAQMH